MAKAKPMTISERLEKYSRADSESGCRIWTAYTSRGYGRLSVNQVAKFAHRVAYEEAFGAIPQGKCVCHKCDNPACIEPRHLFLGSHAENMEDMRKKGRANRPVGERNGRAKLTADAVEAIRSSDAMGKSLAAAYGVTATVVSDIRNGKLWGSVGASRG